MPRKAKVTTPEVVNEVKKGTANDFDIIIEPLITEKSMTMSQENNKATFIVKSDANKIAIKKAIEHIYNVKVIGVQTSHAKSKTVTRGSRYKGTLPGYKKAIITLASGEAIDLFKE
ncbi:MAG: 50S ribosomal protein L23 [Firmicutes bacterium]|uniref:Large ribosomal subunit protein uL23 n=1 Tax=Candidatus Onthovivens merdipullorum TaxID=2840889 RepID=A0A9D9GXL2_9BACL|nr:50S ribosomal protein L23 [Candidatus Onthovivens merdipullorum]